MTAGSSPIPPRPRPAGSATISSTTAASTVRSSLTADGAPTGSNQAVMGAVRRRPLVSLAILCALLAGCDDHSSGRAGPPTSRTGGSEGATTSTVPGPPPTLVDAWFSSDHDGWALTQDACPQPTFPDAHCAVVWKTTDDGASWTRLTRLDVPGGFELGPDSVSAARLPGAQPAWD